MVKMLTSLLEDLEYRPEIDEADKLQLVRSRFENINEQDLQDGQSFFEELDRGIYD